MLMLSFRMFNMASVVVVLAIFLIASGTGPLGLSAAEARGDHVTTPGPVDVNKLPTSATTTFSAGFVALPIAEHELLHGVGFDIAYELFKAHVDPSTRNYFTDSADNVIAILTPATQGTHLDPTKTVGGVNQALDIMKPSPLGTVPRAIDVLILNTAFNWTATGGLEITVVFADDNFRQTDKDAIVAADTAIEDLFGPKGKNPHKFTWTVKRDCSEDAREAQLAGTIVDDCPCNCVPAPSSFALLFVGLGMMAYVVLHRRRQQ